MKIWRITLILFSTIVLWQGLKQYLFCTRYSFTSHQPFAGDRLYNPYQSISSNQWLKCNFHAHCTAWNGVTNGNGNSDDIHRVYDSIGYDVHSVSNYHQIDTASGSAGIYVPAYEHGYNVMKTHQLVVGGEKVTWTDYIFPQSMSNKQDILNQVSADTNAVVILNHPMVRNGYTAKDLSVLSNYHCMEVLNPAGQSFKEWDDVLSAGKPVFIVGNDDTHNVLEKERVGRMCTFVSVPAKSRKDVLKALKEGKSYGVIIGASQDQFSIPKLKTLDVKNDTISLELDQKAVKIEFTGQNGHILEGFSGVASARYTLKKEDHYARVSVYYKNGTSLHFNPVFYYNENPLSQGAVYPNHIKTFFYRSAGLLILLIWARWMFLLLFAKKASLFALPSWAEQFLPKNTAGRGKYRRKRIAW